MRRVDLLIKKCGAWTSPCPPLGRGATLSSMSVTAKKQKGFTIVELLIVIVVIAILATISVVAYNGVQDRAHDTAVKSDLSNFAKKIMLYHAEEGSYPPGNGSSATAGVGNLALSRGSYDTDVYNFYYCTGIVSSNPAFSVGAVSKSGTKFYHSSLRGGVYEYTGTWGTSGTNCHGMLPGLAASTWTHSVGYNPTGPTWYSWTNG